MIFDIVDFFGRILTLYVDAKEGDKAALICLILIGIIIVGGIIFLIISL